MDIGTDRPISATAPGGACSAGASGACSLTVRFYDAYAFAFGDNPGGAPAELIPHSLEINVCGRIRANDLTSAGIGLVAVVDDADATVDRHRPTAILLFNTQLVPTRAERLYVTRVETEQAWTSSAGLDGPSFATRGVVALLFSYQDVPRDGVYALRNRDRIPDDDFYCSDADTGRSTVNGDQPSTGVNGTALVINSPRVDQYGGAGSAPHGCRWGEPYGVITPGFVMVVRSVPLATSGLCR